MKTGNLSPVPLSRPWPSATLTASAS
jgi:hypothetical protein